MNPKINKVIDDIERTKAKISELQTLLPELERKRIDMENTEIIRLVRSADIAPADFPEFVRSLKTARAAVSEPYAVTKSSAVAEPSVVTGLSAVTDTPTLTEQDTAVTTNENTGTATDAVREEGFDDEDGEIAETESRNNDGSYNETQEEDDADV